MVLLVVDTQELVVTKELYHYEQFIENVQLLLKTAREKQTEVIYIRHDDGFGFELTKGAKGFPIIREFQPRPGEVIFDKFVNSAFRDTGLVEYLRSKKEQQVMIVGAQTDYCIDATVKCGFEHGFEMIIPAGCNTTTDNEFMTGEQTYRYYNHKMWNKRYGRCISLEEAISWVMQNNRMSEGKKYV